MRITLNVSPIPGGYQTYVILVGIFMTFALSWGEGSQFKSSIHL